MSKGSVNRRTFIKYNGLAAITVAVPSWLYSQGAEAASGKNEAWEARAKELEGKGPTYTAAAPGKWKGKEGSHVPVATFDSAGVTVVTKHPMTPEHWITTHYIKNEKGTVIGLKEFKGTDSAAKSTFPLPKGTTTITVWSNCNLHDLWSAEPQKA
jgi:desulfoferrodoxin (superoxide reductase-like protein)